MVYPKVLAQINNFWYKCPWDIFGGLFMSHFHLFSFLFIHFLLNTHCVFPLLSIRFAPTISWHWLALLVTRRDKGNFWCISLQEGRAGDLQVTLGGLMGMWGSCSRELAARESRMTIGGDSRILLRELRERRINMAREWHLLSHKEVGRLEYLGLGSMT